MSEFFAGLMGQDSLLRFIAVLFAIALVLAKVVASAVERDKLRASIRFVAADKRARVGCDGASIRVGDPQNSECLTFRVSNIGAVTAADVRIRIVLFAGNLVLGRAERWFPVIGGRAECSVEVGLTEVESGVDEMMLEFTYRDFGDVQRREWEGRTCAGLDAGWCPVRVGLLSRMWYFRRVRVRRL